MKQRNRIFEHRIGFLVEDEGIEVERFWGNLYSVPSRWKEYIENNYSLTAQEYIFRKLWQMQQTTKFGIEEVDSVRHTKKIENGIQIALTKYQKDKDNKVVFILSLDDECTISGQRFAEINQLTKDITEDEIIITDENTFGSNWFQSLNLQADIRVVSQIGNSNDCYDYLKRKADKHQKVVVIGSSRLYKMFYSFVTDIYVNFLEKVVEHPIGYFCPLDLYNFYTTDCGSFTEEEITYKVVHLKKITKNPITWKDTVKSYQFHKMQELTE